ncbi:MAG: LPXTG cell wall anchor domain-containing protein [Candidatus Aenigmarchaeota archaeon]
MKNIEFWIPMVTWIIAVIVITYFIFAFYEVSLAVLGIYVVIIFAGFFILWRRRKRKP